MACGDFTSVCGSGEGVPLRLEHQMVRASAGTGKTTALVGRYVRLLAMGVRPESIVALTFTRKAAGEFFDRIAELLAKASDDPREAEKLREEIALDPCFKPNYPRLLRDLLSKQHQLMLGTLDSFYSRVVRAFPFELGVAGGFEVLEGHELDMARNRAITALFGRVGEREEAGLRYFLEAFKLATFGREEVKLSDLLTRYVGRFHKLLLDTPKGLRWGDECSIWGADGCPYMAADREELKRIKQAFVAALESNKEIADKPRLEKWEELGLLVERAPGTALDGGYFINQNVLSKVEDIRAGEAVVTVSRKKCRLDAMQCQRLLQFLEGVLGADLRVRLRRAEGLQRLLMDFEEVYHAGVRARGAMSFDDLARLLGEISSSRHGGQDQEIALDMAYRLDGAFDHWLLDEFQDTSRVQWAALEDLVDEVVQDDSDTRSFFVVGDVKQAIYGWRDGDARLFGEVLERYNQGSKKRIAVSPLHDSYRSAEPIISTLNRVFGDATAMGELFKKEAVKRWEWEEHRTAGKIAGRPGYVEFLESCREDEGEKAEDETGDAKDKKGGKRTKADCERARLALVAERLREIGPSERGLSCAILVQDNKFADRALDFLRDRCPEMEFVSDSSRLIAHENMLCSAVCSLLQVAAHPGDRLAWRHLEMTPLPEKVFSGLGLRAAVEVSDHVLRDLETNGFARTLRWWCDRIDAAGILDDFARMRADQLVEAGLAYDLKGGSDPGAFLEALEKYEVGDPSGGSAVQIMTVHKSKGLTFDLIFLPDLDGDTLGSRDRADGLLVGRDERRQIRWAIEAPAGRLLGLDDVLVAQKEATQVDEVYEGFCRLYVAMTRPRHGLYLVVDESGSSRKRGAAVRGNFAGWLRMTLEDQADSGLKAQGAGEKVQRVGEEGCRVLYRIGQARWFEDMKRREEAPRADALPFFVGSGYVAGADDGWMAIPPSPTEDRLDSAVPGVVERIPDLVSDQTRRVAMERGTAIHALLEKVGWLGEEGAVPMDWDASESAEEVVACLARPEVHALLQRPSGGGKHELWKEKSFDVLVDGRWLSGVIDRVHVHRNEAGIVQRVEIIDFKSDRVEAESLNAAVEHHSVQLVHYRQAVSALLGLTSDQVELHLVFTCQGKVCRVA